MTREEAHASLRAYAPDDDYYIHAFCTDVQAGINGSADEATDLELVREREIIEGYLSSWTPCRTPTEAAILAICLDTVRVINDEQVRRGEAAMRQAPASV